MQVSPPTPEYCFATIQHWSMCMTKSEWSGWIQAIFSVVAIAAGFFGIWWQLNAQSRASMRHRADEISRANLYAARISSRLGATAAAIADASTLAMFRDETVTKEEAQLAMYRDFARLAGREFFKPADAVLDALVPLPNQCAHRIAKAYDLWEKWKEDVFSPDRE